ncbi:MAG: hypothetical protein C4547_02535 [Phycisphaerales bacterium]|nr:MAG: hypothetical protein C4547_02535 [Phycisphaerales bacterium]
MQNNLFDCLANAGEVNQSIHTCCTEIHGKYSLPWWTCVLRGANAVMFMRERICCKSCNNCPPEGADCDPSLFERCQTPEFAPFVYTGASECRAVAATIKEIEAACCSDVWDDPQARAVCKSGARRIKADRFEACKRAHGRR